MKRVVLHIDRLVLSGFKQEDRQGIAEGIQKELSHIFADPQASLNLTANGDVSRLHIGNISIGQGAKPQRIGAQVAQGIGKGMKT